jgi:hypothetical protein
MRWVRGYGQKKANLGIMEEEEMTFMHEYDYDVVVCCDLAVAGDLLLLHSLCLLMGMGI